MNRRQRSRLASVPADKPSDAGDHEPSPSAPLLLSQVQALLSPDFVASVYATRNQGLRRRLLPLEAMALLLVSFCVQGLPSFAALLDRLAEGALPGLPKISVTPQAFYQRLAALGHERFLLLLREVTSTLRSSPWRRAWVQALAPWATGFYAIDDTTLDALVRRVPELKTFAKGDPQTLAGRLATVLDLTTAKLAEVAFDSDSAANEKTHLLPLLLSLPRGALLVMDLGYFAFPLFDELTAQGFFFVTRLRAKTSYRVLQVLADGSLYRDRVIYLGAYRADRAAHPYRLIELNLGGTWWSYVTNVLEPHRLSAASAWRLYLERWGIEQAFFAIKRVLGLASLRCSDREGVLAQVWSTLTVYQLLQDLRLQVAEAQGRNADDVSWERLVRRIAIYTELPAPKPPLREWLPTRERLEKRGTRVRRAKELPAEVLAACGEAMAEMPALERFEERDARQGKPAPRTKAQLLIRASLSQKGAKFRTKKT